MLFEHVCERLTTRHLAGNTRQADCPICGSVLTIVRVGEDASLSCAGKCTPADVEWHLALVATPSSTLADLLINLGEHIDAGEPIITTLPCGWALLDSTIGGLVGGVVLAWFIAPEYNVQRDPAVEGGLRVVDQNPMPRWALSSVLYAAGLAAVLAYAITA